MPQSGGRDDVSKGAMLRIHASASALACATAAASPAERTGSMARTVSSVASNAIHSLMNRSPFRRPKVRMSACAPVRIMTRLAEGAGSAASGSIFNAPNTALRLRVFPDRNIKARQYSFPQCLIAARHFVTTQTGEAA